MASTWDLLVTVATELLDEGGPDAVTLRDVGVRAGVSRSAPYRHFSSKEALLAAVAARDLRDRQWTRMSRRSTSAAAALRADLQHLVRRSLAHPERFRLTYGRWTIDSADLADAATTSRAGLVDLVVAAQSEGALPSGDPERLTALVTSVVHGACHLALSRHLSRDGKGHADPADLVDDILDYLHP